MKIESSRYKKYREEKRHHPIWKKILIAFGIMTFTAGGLIGGVYCYKTFFEYHISFKNVEFVDITGVPSKNITPTPNLSEKVLDTNNKVVTNVTFILLEEKNTDISKTGFSGLVFDSKTGIISGMSTANVIQKNWKIKAVVTIDGKEYSCVSPSFNVTIDD